MTWNALLPVLILLSSLVPGIVIFFLREESQGLRTTLNMAGATAKVLLIGVMIWGVSHGHAYETRLPLLPDMDLVLHADPLSILFATLSAVLWLLTTLYAVGYLEGSPNRSNFFGFFSLCVSATVGIALAGNLITFLLFYEMLSVATYPLIIHRGTPQALRAGRTYVAYTFTSGAVLFIAVVWLRTLAGPLDFTSVSPLAGYAGEHRTTLIVIFGLLIAGVGAKAVLLPLHGWLPIAMVAPAPVSALLHAVAVVKAGAFGVVRIVYNVYGVELAAELGLLGPLAVLAATTIVYGSVRALYQDDLKRRLAFSTVSQVSYVALGVSIAGPVAATGGLVHLVHQGLMKITLFLCAGNLAETLGIHRIREMNGVGRRMPWTMGAFTLGALGMMGVPPLAGFISKWYLGIGGLAAGKTWVVAVLVASSLLNAAYFLPILYVAWFKEQETPWPEERRFGRLETHWMLLLPPLVTALLVLFVGLLAKNPFSPLGWVQLITMREYR
jgi:multicomponent Na+:H+ antiporter subunit D